MKQFNKYIIFWLSQSISQLGSAMTSFALILWTYEQKHSAMAVSLMSFCNYIPFILVSLIAGSFVDRHNKKAVMLLADSIAAICSFGVLILSFGGNLQVWNIYLVNLIIGIMNAFQQPASAVAIGRIVPQEKISKVSGMNSFSGNLTNVLSPVLSAFIFSFGGLKAILMIDLASFLIAFLILVCVIHIPEEKSELHKQTIFAGAKEGMRFLKSEKGVLYIMLTMALINFFSRLTYENILSPMILARSSGSNETLGIVNAVMGIGGIAGGMIVSFKKAAKKNVKMIYFSAALSFLFGDILMAIGRNAFIWSLAGIAASLPIPFIQAGQNVILYSKIPKEMQGRVFAVRNSIQYCMIPFGILLGGFLADYVFEPFMKSDRLLSEYLRVIVGNGDGSGMAVMFLMTGICGFLISCFAYKLPAIRTLDKT
ncbi:MFS transporter [Ruminococcus sp. Marseille-P6503]|uniref:MFS transporter n=1 Tax=Ruminococcus sp. Marseille-P6503 TaxID=2364796 RepID=UPI000F53C495|nr:MFS transporter [Ruminococcus sp. Marseille-P6503]